MRSVNLKKIAAMSAFGLVALLGTSVATSAQYGGNNRNQNQRIIKQQEKAAKAQAKANEARIRAEQLRQQQWNNGQEYRYNSNYHLNQNSRYRVNRGGRYYNTDQRGADLLRQAVNAGYQQGYRAGQTDRSGRRNSSWNNNSMYRQGTYGYQTYVDRSQYQYYFQQGFQRGYQDGYNTRNQFGSNNGGNILSAILGQILNIQTY
jgi:hypothetical protein